MTRKEEIQIAAKTAYPYNGGTKGYICEASIPIFIQGAEWADNHPKEGLVDINSVCGWLITNINDYIETSFIGEYTTFEEFRVDDMIKDIRKAMEKGE